MKTTRAAGRWRVSILNLIAGVLILLAITPHDASAADVTLAWDPNLESDLDGYGVYFQKAGSGLSYDLYGYVGTTELGDANSPEFTVTGLQQGATYYFAVTAYDASGNESAYSNPVCAQVGPVVTPCTPPSGGAASGGSSSAPGSGASAAGGGSGCFIQSVSR
jgi:chitinase